MHSIRVGNEAMIHKGHIVRYICVSPNIALIAAAGVPELVNSRYDFYSIAAQRSCCGSHCRLAVFWCVRKG